MLKKNCSFCKNPDSEEVVSHLFWTCPDISNFLIDTFAFICNIGQNFTPSKEQFLFGFQNLPPYHPKNFFSLVIKKYIWVTKFRTTNLTLVGLKAMLKSYICDLKYMFQFKSMLDQLNEWNAIYDTF